LAKLERQFLEIVPRTVATENAMRSVRAGKISADIKPIGDRPAGHTAPDAEIVAFARAAYRAEGIQVKDNTSSTDSNVPMNLGIPAITMSHIARAGGAHSPAEWIEIDTAPNVKIKRIVLATILATAGVP
jgi:di/tripeptidase